MGSAGRDALILGLVEGSLIFGAWLIGRARALEPKPAAKIAGMVRDQQTNLPIPFAKVSVDTIPLSVDDEGYFRIDLMPLGTYSVEASAPGYRVQKLQWEINEIKEYVLEVELVPIETLW